MRSWSQVLQLNIAHLNIATLFPWLILAQVICVKPLLLEGRLESHEASIRNTAWLWIGAIGQEQTLVRHIALKHNQFENPKLNTKGSLKHKLVPIRADTFLLFAGMNPNNLGMVEGTRLELEPHLTDDRSQPLCFQMLLSMCIGTTACEEVIYINIIEPNVADEFRSDCSCNIGLFVLVVLFMVARLICLWLQSWSVCIAILICLWLQYWPVCVAILTCLSCNFDRSMVTILICLRCNIDLSVVTILIFLRCNIDLSMFATLIGLRCTIDLFAVAILICLRCNIELSVVAILICLRCNIDLSVVAVLIILTSTWDSQKRCS